MSESSYDVVIVGGRCAGSALAAFLARSGARVIVFEADRLGTDQVVSTHTIHPPGMDVLDELEVGDAIRKISPPAATIRFQVDDAYLDVEPPEGRFECCPRRNRLDGLLQEAAINAGAEFVDFTRVDELLWEEGRVVGVEAVRRQRRVEARGALIVGADGRRSTVAQLVRAEEYLGYDAPRGMFWAYWDPAPAWDGPAHPYDVLLSFSGTDRRVIFTTDHGQILIATLPPVEEARNWRPNLLEEYLRDLSSDPNIGPLTAGSTMASRIRGTISERFYFRRSAGPGWALVGDAGHHKDPILGWGISEALCQAKQLAKAISTGNESAIERYWRQRDVDCLPRFRVGEDRAAVEPITPIFPVILNHLAATPGLDELLFRETEYDVDPYEAIPVSKIVRWTLGEVFHGRLSLIPEFIRQGRRAAAVHAEVKSRQTLLD